MAAVATRLGLKSRLGIIIKGGIVGCVAITTCYSAFVWNKRKQLRRKRLRKTEEERKIIADLKDEITLKYEQNKEHYNYILTLTATQLIASMKDGKLTPDDVLVAFIYKALTVNEDLNCITNALKESFEFLEDVKKKSGSNLPLYGLPVSLKEPTALKGHSVTFGAANMIDKICLEDSVITATLKHCGAVPFVRTNLPQIMMSFEASNPIYGETGNPHNKDFTPGGSSSGEGSLIGAGGSVLGIGSDMAGSIRCPAHLCGICGLKPTKNRLGLKGIVGPLPGHSDLSPAIGPMAKDVDTLVLAMKYLLCDFLFKKDCSVPPLPFNDDVYESKRPLRIGYYYDDGYTKAAPACERAVRMAKQQLEAAGHTLVKFQVPDIENAMKITMEASEPDLCQCRCVAYFSCIPIPLRRPQNHAIFADGGKNLDIFMENDVVDKNVKYIFKNMHRNSVVRQLLSKLMSFKYPRLAQTMMSFAGKGSVHDSWELTAEIWKYQATFFSQWESYDLDAMICPSYPVAACPKGSVRNLAAMMSYTVLYNIVDYPAGVVTITEVNDKDIKDLDNYAGHHNDPWDWHIKRVSKKSLGMPVSVQCVAKTWNEEICLRVMKEVESISKN